MNKIATLTLTVLMLSTVCHFPAAGSRTSAGRETALSSPQRETVYSGKVIDSRTKEPLIGAGVILRDQRTVGVATDLDGSFSISVPDGVKPVFEVSYINYESIFISPSRTSGIVVELEPSSTLLDEVQVIAYGSQRKVSITGSISSINQEELLKSPSGSIANSLAGALTGIIMAYEQASGENLDEGQKEAAMEELVRRSSLFPFPKSTRRLPADAGPTTLRPDGRPL